MPEEQFVANPTGLKSLLEDIHDGDIALPEFQRDFVWAPRMTRELLVSVMSQYPAGNLLRIRNGRKPAFALRKVVGAPKLSSRPSFLILDGQQRLTSLYHALYGAGEHRYFMDMSPLIEGLKAMGDSDEFDSDVLEKSIVYATEQRAEKRFGSLEEQARDLVFSFARLSNRQGLDFWFEDVEKHHKDKYRKVLRDIRDRCFSSILDYRFPVVTLSEDTKADAVCSIFETLNRTGVKLTVFDLLTAKHHPKNVRLRDMWEQACETYPILADFYGNDPYHIIQAIAIFTATKSTSCKRRDILDMSAARVKEGWDPVVKAVADMLTILQEECGVVNYKYLPYHTMIIPAGAVLAKQQYGEGPKAGAIREKMTRWFWCSVFAQTYESSANTQAVNDYRELNSWIDGGDEPEVVREFEFDPDILRETTSRQRAVYYGCLALILSMGAVDFDTRRRIDATFVGDGKVDDHHIFPKGYLKGADKKTENCVLNRTLISARTNRRISKKPPKKYLGEIENEDKKGVSSLKKILDSHLLPSEEGSPLRKNDFEAFLAKRQELLYDKIKEVTGLK